MVPGAGLKQLDLAGEDTDFSLFDAIFPTNVVHQDSGYATSNPVETPPLDCVHFPIRVYCSDQDM